MDPALKAPGACGTPTIRLLDNDCEIEGVAEIEGHYSELNQLASNYPLHLPLFELWPLSAGFQCIFDILEGHEMWFAPFCNVDLVHKIIIFVAEWKSLHSMLQSKLVVPQTMPFYKLWGSH